MKNYSESRIIAARFHVQFVCITDLPNPYQRLNISVVHDKEIDVDSSQLQHCKSTLSL